MEHRFQDISREDFADGYDADLQMNQTWYTDSNGRDMQQRKFDYRPTWPLIVTDPFVLSSHVENC